MSRRRTILFLAIAAVAISLSATSAYPAKAARTQCSNIPFWLTIMPTDGGIVAGDAKGIVYKNGADGVTGNINICGTAPTYDAIIDLTASTRTMAFTFPAAIPGSNISGPSPAWANGTTFNSGLRLWVRNILWGRMNGTGTFTTRVIMKSIAGPGEAVPYDLRLQSDFAQAVTNDPPFADTNLPQQTATVTVQDVPGTCREVSAGTLDSWIVTVDPAYVGTLYRQGGRREGYVHSGQYVTPMKFLVEAQSCVPASLTLLP